MDHEASTHNLLEHMLLDEDAEPTDLPISLLKSITNNFSDGMVIGRGGSAVVYKGLLQNGTVAVKKLRQTIDIHEEKFNQEVCCLMRLKHKNIVRFLGYCGDTQAKMWTYEAKMVMADVRQRLLCFEFLRNGSLNEYITDASQGLEWITRYKIIKGICEGLHYLHQNNIVHRDLKPANILLTYNMVPKIADFGLSRCFDEKQTQAITSKLVGSWGYLPPEFYSGLITLKLDIYSLGVIIMEILTGQKGHPGIDSVLKSWSGRFKTSLGDTRLEQVRVCAEIGIECIDSNPVKRPVTGRIIETLDKMELTYPLVETNLCCSAATHAKDSGLRQEKRRKELKEDSHSIVKSLLTKCAEALSEKRIWDFHKLVHEARGVVSITGRPIERLGVCLLEGLVARDGNFSPNTSQLMYLHMQCSLLLGNQHQFYRSLLHEICPYFKFGFMSANGAIAGAMEHEDKIHIIDFQIAQGRQWITLLQAWSARPSVPHVRITGILDTSMPEYAHGDDLESVEKMLKSVSEHCHIPLEFSPLSVCATQVTKEMFEIRPGEALVVNFNLLLHRIPDESVDINSQRDGLLRMVKGLSPKVITIVEHELDTSMAPFLMRFGETMDYWSAMFESIDVVLSRSSTERTNVEQYILAKDIVNIIACEGKDRVTRPEPLVKWKSRLAMAGFRPYPLYSVVNSTIRRLLAAYHSDYTVEENSGSVFLGWKNRNLISASAWH